MAVALLNRFVLRRYLVEAMPKTVGTISDGGGQFELGIES
jgi:hypothetical protein